MSASLHRLLLRGGALVCTAALSAHAAGEFARVFPLDEKGLVGSALLVIFTLCFGWVALGAMLFAFGLAAAAAGDPRSQQPGTRPAPAPGGSTSRTAVLLPIRHEDAEQVCAQVEVMFEALRREELGPRVDFALLSDSSEPEACLEEEEAWRALCERLGAFGRIFYRRRARGEAKKAGNVRDFCVRHAGAYQYLMVLDADSMLEARTFRALVERMDANPRVGLIQVPSLPVRHRSPFARWQQFAARVYGPLWATAEAALAGPDGTYYGHNAIIRREAFCDNAGLAALPGDGPLSGLIASHDFVEAALVRRAGYEVWLAADLEGSYEQCPTTLVDYAVRDQRWCHGNLQHLRVALLPGLTSWTRLHLVRGAASYLIPPLTLLFTWGTLFVAAGDQGARPEYFPPAGRALFPSWPVHDFAAGRDLLVLTAVLLFGPKLLAAAAGLAEMLGRRLLPLRRLPAFAASLVIETALGVLLAPTLMVYQATFVVSVLLYGERVPWGAARRADRTLPLGEAVRRTWLQLACAAVLATAGWSVSSQALLWTLPVVVPLALAPALAWLTSSERVGRWCDALGLLQVPEDWSQDPTLTVYDRAGEAPARPRSAPDDARGRARRTLVRIGSGLVRRGAERAG